MTTGSSCKPSEFTKTEQHEINDDDDGDGDDDDDY